MNQCNKNAASNTAHRKKGILAGNLRNLHGSQPPKSAVAMSGQPPVLTPRARGKVLASESVAGPSTWTGGSGLVQSSPVQLRRDVWKWDTFSKQGNTAVGRDQWYHFGVRPILDYFVAIGMFTGGYGLLTHGHSAEVGYLRWRLNNAAGQSNKFTRARSSYCNPDFTRNLMLTPD